MDKEALHIQQVGRIKREIKDIKLYADDTLIMLDLGVRKSQIALVAGRTTSDDMDKAFADEMVARWNDYEELKAKLAAAEAQRDELRAALVATKKHMAKSGINHDNAELWNSINAALEASRA